MCRRVIENSKKIYRREIEARKMKGSNHSVGILKEYGKDILRVCFGYTNGFSCIMNGALRLAFMVVIMLVMGITNIWGQVTDGVYYITNTDNPDNLPDPNPNGYDRWYLWPSVTTNATTGQQYLTTYYDAQAAACNESGVKYEAYDNSYSHWVVKYLTDGTGRFQLINPKLNKYIVIRSKATYGDRDVWLDDEPTGNEIVRSFFKLNGAGPYLISPAINATENIANATEYTAGTYTLNSAKGNKRYICSTDDKQTPKNLDQRQGLLQFYNDAPSWTFTQDLLAAPTISDVSTTTGRVTITDANSLPAGYTIRYTTDSTDPTATTGTEYSGPIDITSSCTVKAVVVRYGIVLTSVASKAVTPVVALPVISFNNTTNETAISCVTAGATIYYTTDGSTPTTSSTSYNTSFSVTSPTTVKAIAVKGATESDMATLAITQVATPTIQDNGSNAISITTATGGATIYYTTDGSTPTTSSTQYNGPLTENVSNVTIKAIAVKENMITSNVGSGTVKLQCATPVITRDGMTFSISCSMPTDASLYYSLDGSTPATSYSGSVSFTSEQLPMIVTAVAKHTNYTDSESETFTLVNGHGTSSDPYLIYGSTDFANFINNVNAGTTSSAFYKLETDISASSASAITTAFTGTFDGGLHTISNLGHALFNTVDGGTVKNVVLDNITINSGTNVGAICNEATGASRIYNCGVLPSTNGSSISGSGDVGSIVGLLDGTSRVINCYSYATVSGGTNTGGIVGNNAQVSTMSDIKTIIVNCMFYGEITGGGYPVYGGNVIENSGTTAINNYNYYRGEAAFDDSYSSVDNYNRSWPAEEQNLTRFEYYRSILNSNRKLCTWWVNGTNGTAPTDEDVETVGIAKWVLDPSIAPYPILKKWGKYPSIINPDPARTWRPSAKDATGVEQEAHWVTRSSAKAYEGKKLGTITIKVKTGSHPGTLTGLSEKSEDLEQVVVTDMDTLNHDFGYAKVQLPYYNEVFGNPNSNSHLTRYYGNYTDKVVTAWKITEVTTDGTVKDYHSFVANWETGYNYADRYCTAKDIYTSNDNRAFAQGGYYYVPEGVTGITIEAIWGTAFYLHGKGHYIDHVNVTNSKNYGSGFTPAGTLSSTMPYGSISIYDDFNTLMTAVKTNKTCNVYEQAVVLVGNFPLHAQNDCGLGNSGQGGFTIMSADFDMDNEPDFCFPLQWRSNTDRLPIMPVRFDFLPVPELGLVMRHNTYAYAIGIFVPQGHFEITETSLMHTTQFEYMSSSVNVNHQQPLILNGGEFEQIVVHGSGSNSMANTRNIILGGHVWMKRFTPGSHTGQHAYVRHCAVSVMGGEFPEFYLTGLYWTGVTTSNAYNDSPHCYTNGGRFGIMAGAGMEAVKNSVYFEIDHSIIDEFYGGGINSNNPVGGNISVTINNSLVLDKYCGGPKVGTSGTVTTNAKGTVFNQYFGGGNGGTNLYREQIADQTPDHMPNESEWRGNTYKFDNFTPIANQGENVTYDASKGYHAEFEFEVFNQSNGINNSAVARTYRHWAQFGTTQTGTVSNTLIGCTIKHNYYSGGNLGNVDGNVTSTLTDCTVLGNAYGAGFSASIPHFPVHDKSLVTFPMRDKAGVCHNGSVGYRKDAGEIRQYTWCYKNPTTNVVTPAGVVIPNGVSTSKPVFQYDGKWYCYTTVSLENLGTVSGTVNLKLNGETTIGIVEDTGTGFVFGGGDESAVNGNVTVILSGNAEVLRNVFGGGNKGIVSGSTEVNIVDTSGN